VCERVAVGRKKGARRKRAKEVEKKDEGRLE